MLAKINRLPSPEIRLVLHRGKRINFSAFILISKANGFQESRFCFIAGINIDKRATVRNRIKRLLRESVRRLLPQIKKGFDVIILAKKGLIAGSQIQIEESIKTILKNAGLYNNLTT